MRRHLTQRAAFAEQPVFASSSSRAGAPKGRTISVIVRAEADYYATLGVSKGSDKKAIKSAYRGLARKFHPDINKAEGAEAKFKQVRSLRMVAIDTVNIKHWKA